jgi:hypothetical protein
MSDIIQAFVPPIDAKPGAIIRLHRPAWGKGVSAAKIEYVRQMNEAYYLGILPDKAPADPMRELDYTTKELSYETREVIDQCKN